MDAGIDGAECSMKVASRRRMAVALRSLVNARDLQIECVRVLHETLLVLVLTYDSERMLWKEKEKSRIRAVQMDSLRGLIGIRRMDNPKCTDKGVDERIDEGVLWWFGNVERMEKDRIAKRVYVGECAGSYSVGRPRKRWIDTMKVFKQKKKGVWMSGKQGEWSRIGVNGGGLEGSAGGIAQGMNPRP